MTKQRKPCSSFFLCRCHLFFYTLQEATHFTCNFVRHHIGHCRIARAYERLSREPARNCSWRANTCSGFNLASPTFPTERDFRRFLGVEQAKDESNQAPLISERL